MCEKFPFPFLDLYGDLAISTLSYEPKSFVIKVYVKTSTRLFLVLEPGYEVPVFSMHITKTSCAN